jgi:ribonuclease M5
MIKLRQAVIVEGRYDKIKLQSVIDTLIITTDGFGIFKDKEKLQFIRELACTRGVIIMTDSDSAGFKIRSYISGSVNDGSVINVYIPEIFGKERRKASPSAEGILGVEGVDIAVIEQALDRAGVTADSRPQQRVINKLDLYRDGLYGGRNSAALRKAFLRHVGLPSRISANMIPEAVAYLLTYEQYCAAVSEVKAAFGVKNSRQNG